MYVLIVRPKLKLNNKIIKTVIINKSNFKLSTLSTLDATIIIKTSRLQSAAVNVTEQRTCSDKSLLLPKQFMHQSERIAPKTSMSSSGYLFLLPLTTLGSEGEQLSSRLQADFSKFSSTRLELGTLAMVDT